MTIAPMPRGTHMLSSWPSSPAIDSPKPTTYSEQATACRRHKQTTYSEQATACRRHKQTTYNEHGYGFRVNLHT